MRSSWNEKIAIASSVGGFLWSTGLCHIRQGLNLSSLNCMVFMLECKQTPRQPSIDFEMWCGENEEIVSKEWSMELCVPFTDKVQALTKYNYYKVQALIKKRSTFNMLT